MRNDGGRISFDKNVSKQTLKERFNVKQAVGWKCGNLSPRFPDVTADLFWAGTPTGKGQCLFSCSCIISELMDGQSAVTPHAKKKSGEAFLSALIHAFWFQQSCFVHRSEFRRHN